MPFEVIVKGALDQRLPQTRVGIEAADEAALYFRALMRDWPKAARAVFLRRRRGPQDRAPVRLYTATDGERIHPDAPLDLTRSSDGSYAARAWKPLAVDVLDMARPLHVVAREARETLGLSQAGMAAALGATVALVSRMESAARAAETADTQRMRLALWALMAGARCSPGTPEAGEIRRGEAHV